MRLNYRSQDELSGFKVGSKKVVLKCKLFWVQKKIHFEIYALFFHNGHFPLTFRRYPSLMFSMSQHLISTITSIDRQYYLHFTRQSWDFESLNKVITHS